MLFNRRRRRQTDNRAHSPTTRQPRYLIALKSLNYPKLRQPFVAFGEYERYDRTHGANIEVKLLASFVGGGEVDFRIAA